MAMLARAGDGPGPLEGVRPDVVAAAARAALSAGLVDELDFLAPPAAGAALYALAAALPVGAEQRELGRRVLVRLLAGDAETFAAIATAMATGGGKGLGSAAVRARVALVCELPVALGVRDGPMALALVGRRQLARDFLVQPSTGSLPARRLAARLLERAATEVARRAAQGDAHAVRTFSSETVRSAFARLLQDRESLVWRWVAGARGLLVKFIDAGLETLDEETRPELSPTEWRRAATSIGALAAVDPDAALARARALLAGPVLRADSGVAAALLFGASRVAEVEPEAARALLDEVVRVAPLDAAEPVAELVSEWGAAPFLLPAIEKVRAALGRSGAEDARALEQEMADDLEGANERASSADLPLRVQVGRALAAYATHGSKAAAALARTALEAAVARVEAIEAIGDEETSPGVAGSMARRTSIGALRDLDLGLLESGALRDLMRLGERSEKGEQDEAVDALRERLASWILAREAALDEGGGEGFGTLRLRRLRTLVHLVDADVGDEADASRAARLRKRWARTAHALLARLEVGPPPLLLRATAAALARALDALVRADALDPVDAVLACALRVPDASRFEILSEACMDPDLRHAFARYAAFARAAEGDASQALEAWAEAVLPDPSSRAETLRGVLLRTARALREANAAPALRALSRARGTEADVVADLESALVALGQMCRGARHRLEVEETSDAECVPQRPIAVDVARVLSGAEPELDREAVRAAGLVYGASVPAVVAGAAQATIDRIAALPVEEPRSAPPPSTALPPSRDAALPAWVPARRTLGGFYLLRTLGAGGTGSVFVAVRAEDRNDPDAERFALKVPDYSAEAARSLSEAEFLKLFRDEAQALLALPAHPNLARFVTFDVSARPKPILVMELVEGVTLAHVVEARALDMARCLAILDGILAGLEAMHALGVGHLDVKPHNVLLRSRATPDGGRVGDAVLVDFGLSGRHVRPGCATGAYGAPEVWTGQDGKVVLSPAKVDVYAFGCLAFEALTGRVLFASPSEMAQVSMHLVHDGFPEPLRALAADHPGLAELLFSTLRRDPANRPTVDRIRSELARLAPQLSRQRWPLGAPSAARARG